LCQDAKAIWHKLSVLVRAAAPDHRTGYDPLTQDLFHKVLTTDRVQFYVEPDYTESEIRADLIGMIDTND